MGKTLKVDGKYVIDGKTYDAPVGLTWYELGSRRRWIVRPTVGSQQFYFKVSEHISVDEAYKNALACLIGKGSKMQMYGHRRIGERRKANEKTAALRKRASELIPVASHLVRLYVRRIKGVDTVYVGAINYDLKFTFRVCGRFDDGSWEKRFVQTYNSVLKLAKEMQQERERLFAMSEVVA